MNTTLLCSLCMVLVGQTAPDRISVTKAVEQLRVAMMSGEENVLFALTSPSLSYGHSNGVVENQLEFVASLTSGKYKFLSIDLDNQTIDIVQDVAIVRHRLFAHTADAGKPKATVSLHVLTVWKEVDDRWILVARQAAKSDM